MAVVATSLSCSGVDRNGGGHCGGTAAQNRPEDAERNGHRVQLFDGLGPDDMAEVTAAARSMRKERSEFVYTPGDPAETVYVLKKGRVKLSVLSESGKEFAIDIFHPGDIFGEFALADETTRSNMAQALDEALVWVFRKRDFVRLLETRPKLAMNYIRLVGLRRRRMEKKLSDITAKDVASRVCELLHEISTSSADTDAASRELLVPLTHQDVASLIGAARQTTTTVLNDLERRGIIELGRGWIRVTHLKELQVYVGSFAFVCAQLIFHFCQLADSITTTPLT